MSVVNVKYVGPIKGRIRTVMRKRTVMRLFAKMESEVKSRAMSRLGEWLNVADTKVSTDEYYTRLRDDIYAPICEEVSNLYNNKLGMYIYPTQYAALLRFAYVDCEMKDVGIPVYGV